MVNVPINVVVMCGVCSGGSEVRDLASGTRLASLSLRVKDGDAAATSVPVTVWDPAGWVEDLVEGDEIVVVGSVRRRFYRSAAGGTGSRVDVEASYVARTATKRAAATARRRVEVALETALEALTG
jgi:Single-strand binding protein family